MWHSVECPLARAFQAPAFPSEGSVVGIVGVCPAVVVLLSMSKCRRYLLPRYCCLSGPSVSKKSRYCVAQLPFTFSYFLSKSLSPPLTVSDTWYSEPAPPLFQPHLSGSPCEYALQFWFSKALEKFYRLWAVFSDVWNCFTSCWHTEKETVDWNMPYNLIKPFRA